MDNTNNFIFSAIAAFTLYIVLLLSLLYYSKNHNIKKIDSITKATVLQLDIVVDIKKGCWEKNINK